MSKAAGGLWDVLLRNGSRGWRLCAEAGDGAPQWISHLDNLSPYHAPTWDWVRIVYSVSFLPVSTLLADKDRQKHRKDILWQSSKYSLNFTITLIWWTCHYFMCMISRTQSIEYHAISSVVSVNQMSLVSSPDTGHCSYRWKDSLSVAAWVSPHCSSLFPFTPTSPLPYPTRRT